MFDTFSTALTALLSVLCIIVMAIWLRRMGRISPETDHGLLRLTIDFLLPCMMMDRILKSDAFSDAQNLWLPPLLGFGLTAIGILIGFVVTLLPGKLTGLTSTKQKRTFAACVGVLNYGFVPIPLVDAMFPNDFRTSGVLFLMFLGAEVSIWTLVLCTIEGKFSIKHWKRLFTMPVNAILVAVAMNLLDREMTPQMHALLHSQIVPWFGFLLKAIHMVGQASIPISLIVIGLTVSTLFHRKNFQDRLATTLRIGTCSCLIRVLLMPAIFLTLAVFLPCTPEIKRILVIHGAMGSAIFPVVLTQHFGGHTETAFDTILSNTLLSVVTLPIWITLGLKMI